MAVVAPLGAGAVVAPQLVSKVTPFRSKLRPSQKKVIKDPFSFSQDHDRNTIGTYVGH